MKKLFENKFFLVIVAFLISVSFWCYVVLGTNPTYTAWVKVPKVVYEGLADITDKGFFFIGDIDEMASDIQVRATGARSLVTKSNEDLSEAAQKFFDFITSEEANEIISAAGVVPAN